MIDVNEEPTIDYAKIGGSSDYISFDENATNASIGYFVLTDPDIYNDEYGKYDIVFDGVDSKPFKITPGEDGKYYLGNTEPFDYETKKQSILVKFVLQCL